MRLYNAHWQSVNGGELFSHIVSLGSFSEYDASDIVNQVLSLARSASDHSHVTVSRFQPVLRICTRVMLRIAT
jgi:hypothetical protein